MRAALSIFHLLVNVRLEHIVATVPRLKGPLLLNALQLFSELPTPLPVVKCLILSYGQRHT